MSSPQLILVRGAPGVGKSSLIRKVAEYYPNSVVIETDELHKMLPFPHWRDDEENLEILNIALQTAQELNSKNKKPIFIIEVFIPKRLDIFIKTLDSTTFKNKYKILTLKSTNSVLKERILNRENGTKDLENAFYCNEEIIRKQYDNEVIVDTSNENISTLTTRLKQLIQFDD